MKRFLIFAGKVIVAYVVTSFLVGAVSYQLLTKDLFNGIITNDKFCLSRTGQLKLNWWRRPLRLR